MRAEENKKERKKDTKTVANWLFAQTTHVVGSKSNFGWWVACSVQLYISSVIQIGQGVTALWGSKMALSYYFGQWLIQQLVLPYKP